MQGWLLLLFLTFTITGSLFFPLALRWIAIVSGVGLFVFCLVYHHLDSKGKLL